MLNFTSIYYWEATQFAKSLIKTKGSGFRPPNLAIFFLTKYTMIHKCLFCTNLSAIYIAREDNSFDHPVTGLEYILYLFSHCCSTTGTSFRMFDPVTRLSKQLTKQVSGFPSLGGGGDLWSEY